MGKWKLKWLMLWLRRVLVFGLGVLTVWLIAFVIFRTKNQLSARGIRRRCHLRHCSLCDPSTRHPSRAAPPAERTRSELHNYLPLLQRTCCADLSGRSPLSKSEIGLPRLTRSAYAKPAQLPVHAWSAVPYSRASRRRTHCVGCTMTSGEFGQSPRLEVRAEKRLSVPLRSSAAKRTPRYGGCFHTSSHSRCTLPFLSSHKLNVSGNNPIGKLIMSRAPPSDMSLITQFTTCRPESNAIQAG